MKHQPNPLNKMANGKKVWVQCGICANEKPKMYCNTLFECQSFSEAYKRIHSIERPLTHAEQHQMRQLRELYNRTKEVTIKIENDYYIICENLKIRTWPK